MLTSGSWAGQTYTPGWGLEQRGSLGVCHISMWSLQQSGFREAGSLTWWSRHPKQMSWDRESQVETTSLSVTYSWRKSHCRFCSILLVENSVGQPRLKRREDKLYLLMANVKVLEEHRDWNYCNGYCSLLNISGWGCLHGCRLRCTR